MDSKLDESVEILPKSPDVNLEIGVDVSVVGNSYLVEVIEALRDPAAHERAAELTPAAIAKARETARLDKTA